MQAELTARLTDMAKENGSLIFQLEQKSFEVASLKGLLNCRTALGIKVPLALAMKFQGVKPRGVQSGLTLLVMKDMTFLPFVQAVCLREGLVYEQVKEMSLYHQLCRDVHDAAATVQVRMDSKLTCEARAAVCCCFEHYGVQYEVVDKTNKIIPSPYSL